MTLRKHTFSGTIAFDISEFEVQTSEDDPDAARKAAAKKAIDYACLNIQSNITGRKYNHGVTVTRDNMLDHLSTIRQEFVEERI